MNTFLTFLVRQDHCLQIAAHLAGGIMALIVVTGVLAPRKTLPPAQASHVALHVAAAGSHPTLVADAHTGR